jgi:hypothetical protein
VVRKIAHTEQLSTVDGLRTDDDEHHDNRTLRMALRDQRLCADDYVLLTMKK